LIVNHYATVNKVKKWQGAPDDDGRKDAN